MILGMCERFGERLDERRQWCKGEIVTRESQILCEFESR